MIKRVHQANNLTMPLADLAALYMIGIAKAHAFVDGNKRTAWAVARAFLALNGHGLRFDRAEAVELVRQAADSRLDADDVARWFRARLAAQEGS